jgi:hypothetical protein
MQPEDDLEKLMRELVFEQVANAIKEDRKNWVSRLEELGFQWFDDEDGQEGFGEASAKPENPDQELLVAFFEGSAEPSEQVLTAYLGEKESDNPNYPLIRRYFKTGNQNLLNLLTYGLEGKPTDIGLLGDFGFFHEHSNILADLISQYLRACEIEQDMDSFQDLVMSFYYDTEPDGLDVFYELEQQFSPDSVKGKIIWKIRQEQELEPEVVKF